MLAWIITKEWRQSIDLLEKMINPPVDAYGTVFKRALSENEVDLGWRVLNLAHSKQIDSTVNMFSNYWDYCCQINDKATQKVAIVNVLKFIDKIETVLPKSTISGLLHLLDHGKYHYSLERMARSSQFESDAICNRCGNHLSLNKVSSEEFLNLRNVLLEQTTKNQNIGELHQIIQEKGSFDYIIDALAVTGQKQSISPKERAESVSSRFKFFFVSKNSFFIFN